MELNQNTLYDVTADDWWENITVYWRGSYTLVDYDRDIIFKRLKKKIARVLTLNEDTIDEKLDLQTDLNLDPLEITFLVSVLECEYNLQINNQLACRIDTISDLLNYCQQTWPSREKDSWFPDPLALEPEPKTQIRRILKYINQVSVIKKVTTFLRRLFKRPANPLQKYIIQGRRRWVKIEDADIDPTNEIINQALENWELWTDQNRLDWYGAKLKKEQQHEAKDNSN